MSRIEWVKLTEQNAESYIAYYEGEIIGEAHRSKEDGLWIASIPSISFKGKGMYRHDLFDSAQVVLEETQNANALINNTVSKSIKLFLSDNCELRKSFGNDKWAAFIYIYKKTNGNPCRECFYKVKCKIYRTFITNTSTNYSETNSEVAERLGISKRKVSKMRRNGEI